MYFDKNEGDEVGVGGGGGEAVAGRTFWEELFKERMSAAEHGTGEITKQQVIVLVNETRHAICHLK